MPISFDLRAGRIVATVLVAIIACGAQLAWGQSSAPIGLLPLLSNPPAASPVSPAVFQQPMNIPRRAPMARLVANPDQTEGAPPFALADQTGTIQRYVEPVPGMELSPYVGQIVTVRHDTGSTLLASQLELPPPSLRAMPGDVNDRYANVTDSAGNWRRTAQPAGAVQQVQYIDNDDNSVQLLPEQAAVADPAAMATGGLMPLDGAQPAGDFPVYAEQIGPPPGMEQPMMQPGMPMQYQPGMMGYPTECEVAAPDRTHLSADVELMWLRPQITETSTGKLSEDYQFSPRVILELDGAGNFDGRLRYWHYNHNSELLDTPNNIRIKFDVLDIEALHHFRPGKSELTLSAGLRLAGIHLTDIAEAQCSTDLLGLTMAADGMTPLGAFPGGHFGLVYGGRLSLLGGNWGGDDTSQFINQQIRNDNVMAHELYGGVEMTRRCRVAAFHARLLFEMQNWQSDALSQNAGINSIGLLGPAVQLGAEF